MPPSGLGFRIETPPIWAKAPRPSKPPTRPAGGREPGGAGSAPGRPPLSGAGRARGGAQAAERADVDAAGLGVGGGAAVDIDPAARARRVPGTLVSALAGPVGERGGNELPPHAAALRELERRVLYRRGVVDEVGLAQALL